MTDQRSAKAKALLDAMAARRSAATSPHAAELADLGRDLADHEIDHGITDGHLLDLENQDEDDDESTEWDVDDDDDQAADEDQVDG